MNNSKFAFFHASFSTLARLARDDAQWRKRASVLVLCGLVMGVAAVMLALVSYPATADYELPPREEPPNSSPDVTVEGGVGASMGVRVYLEGEFPMSWPWETVHWQEDLWHEVEWYSEQNGWTQVNGWHGRFDAIYQEDEMMVARRELWGENHHVGTGPFRWRVYRSENGALLASSDAFYMPQQPGNIVIVRQEMTP